MRLFLGIGRILRFHSQHVIRLKFDENKKLIVDQRCHFFDQIIKFIAYIFLLFVC